MRKSLCALLSAVGALAATRNVSGPYDEVDYPDGSGGQTGGGNQWWTIGPHSRANTGLPARS